jgi:hypothetical protein
LHNKHPSFNISCTNIISAAPFAADILAAAIYQLHHKMQLEKLHQYYAATSAA